MAIATLAFTVHARCLDVVSNISRFRRQIIGSLLISNNTVIKVHLTGYIVTFGIAEHCHAAMGNCMRMCPSTSNNYLIFQVTSEPHKL